MTTQQVTAHNYGATKVVTLSHADAVNKARTTLVENGWGVISEIDICNIMKEKMGVEFPKFTILGACNPILGLQALQTEEQIGLLMPCNVVIRDAGGKTEVAVASAVGITSLCKNSKLDNIATQADAELRKVLDLI